MDFFNSVHLVEGMEGKMLGFAGHTLLHKWKNMYPS